ncbi:MAG: hypothetical protein IPI42_04830 [Saprospiraceae bacterium]|nr:hypothetical protein [Candidatus Parvibacillus calidus]
MVFLNNPVKTLSVSNTSSTNGYVRYRESIQVDSTINHVFNAVLSNPAPTNITVLLLPI